MSNIHVDPRYEIVDPQSQEELEQLLLEMFPDNRINVNAFFEEAFCKFDKTIFIREKGHRNWMTPAELAEYLWKRSNYHELDSDNDEDYAP